MKGKWILAVIALCISLFTGCSEDFERKLKDRESRFNGLQRVATVYDQNGKEMKTYKGKFDIEVNEYGNKVKFDVAGKRVLIYNATVIVEEQ